VLQLIARVDIWRQDVKNQTELFLQAQAKDHFHAPRSRHGMNLRSKDSHTITHDRPNHHLSVPCRVLATTSPNIRRSKRKAVDYQPTVNKRSRKMDFGSPNKRGNTAHGHKDEQGPFGQQEAPRPRGRPPGSKNKPKDVDKGLEQLSLGEIPTILPSDPSSKASLPSGQSKKSSSPRKGSLSPAKRLGKQIDQTFSQDAVVLTMLEDCDPPVLLRSPQELRESGIPIPKAVLTLYNTLMDIPSGVTIPKIAQASFCSRLNHADTPRKSKEAPRLYEYLSEESSPWSDNEIKILKLFVDHMLRQAQWNEANSVHERQWGHLAIQSVDAFSIWPVGSSYRSINIETSPIEPIELRPILSKKEIIDESIDSDKNSGQEDSILLSRYVDWLLALTLDHSELRLIHKAYQYHTLWSRSLNQTVGPTANCPIFLDIEVKKTHTVRDSRIQLAIWETAAIKKRKLHGWSTSFPIPAITVDGHQWTLYIFYELSNEEVIMMGPINVGSTRDRQEAWRLLRMLWALIQWGIGDYRKDFFEKDILGWAKRVVSGPRPEGPAG
ncbi:MAG: hypothetical protein Q9214_002108, partial [Letrouitia sp. 1 TL-2023]